MSLAEQWDEPLTAEEQAFIDELLAKNGVAVSSLNVKINRTSVVDDDVVEAELGAAVAKPAPDLKAALVAIAIAPVRP